MRSPHLVVLGVALLLTTASCSAPSPPARPDQLTIVTASYPLQFLAERVAGETAVVVNLTSPGAEPHDLELTAQQLNQIARADVVVYQKGFQPAVDEAIAAVGPKAVVDVAAGITLAPAHGGAGQERGVAADPHIWLDPNLMVTMARNVSEAVIAASPGEEQVISASTEELVADLTALDTAFDKGLTSCRRRVFVTSHEAFGYLARAYDLTQIPIAGLDPTVEPTAARIKEVQAMVNTHGITTIFFETLVSDAVARAIADDLDLKTDVLDPLEGIIATSRGSDYLEVMESNLAALRTANECS